MVGQGTAMTDNPLPPEFSAPKEPEPSELAKFLWTAGFAMGLIIIALAVVLAVMSLI